MAASRHQGTIRESRSRPLTASVIRSIWVLGLLLASLAAHAAAPPTQPAQGGEQSGMPPGERDRQMLAKAQELTVKVFALCRKKQFSEALPLAEEVVRIRKQVLGVGDTGYAEALNNLGNVYDRLGRYDDAEPLLRKANEIMRAALGERNQFYALSLDNLAALYEHKGDAASAAPLRRQAREIHARAEQVNALNRQVNQLFHERRFAEAVPLADEAVQMQKELVGEQHPYYAASMSNLAVLYGRIGEYAKAESLFLHAMQIQKEVLGDRHQDYASTLYSLAAMYETTRDYVKAEGLYREASDITRRNEGEEHLSYAASLDKLAAVCVSAGEYAKAEPLYVQAMQIIGKALGERHPGYAVSLDKLANLYKEMGDFSKAEPLLIRSMLIVKQANGEQDPAYAASLNNLAVLYEAMGDYAKAEPLARQSAQITKQAIGERSPDYATSLNNLASVYGFMGDYARAEPMLRQSIQITKEALGDRDPGYAIGLGNLAKLYFEMGDLAKAEPLAQQSMQITKQALGEHNPSYATCLDMLAGLYMDAGDYASALPLFRKSLQIKKEVTGEHNLTYAVSLNNLASLYNHMGEYGTAEPLFRQAIQIMRNAGGEHYPEYATSLGNLALVYTFTGDYKRAEPLYRESIHIKKEVLGEQNLDYAGSLGNLACLYDQMGEDGKAVELGGQALQVARRDLDLTSAVQSERQQLRMQEQLRGNVDGYLTFSLSAGTRASEVYEAVLAWKGAVSRRQRQMRALRRFAAEQGKGAVQARAAALGAELEETSRSLAALTLSTPGVAQFANAAWLRERDQKFVELNQRVEALQQDLAKLSEPFGMGLRSASVKEVAEALPPGSALLDVLEYDRLVPPPGHMGQPTWEPRLAAFVVRRGRDVARVELGPSAAVTDAVERWRQTYGMSAAGQAAGAELRKLLWQPLSPELAGVELLVVSPDGPLSRFPLGALPGAEPGHYLIEELKLALVAVPQDLPRLLAAGAPAGQPSMLLVGDVDYETRAPRPTSIQVAQAGEQPPRSTAARGRDGLTWPALAGTGPEADQILAEFQDVYGARGDKPLLLKGTQATVQAVLDAAPHSRYIHLATHGFFSPPEVHAAVSPSTRPSGMIDADDSRREATGFHPGLMSGIVLAGANHPSQDAGDDGILTALEVSELDLGGVDLAVLSACDTGLGQAAGGEGLLGLQRAFQVAGARAVVASMWSVSDRQTQALMARFYANLWSRRMGKLDALREAQLWLLHGGIDEPTANAHRGLGAPTTVPADLRAADRRMPPYAWAGFVLAGDWR